MRNGKKVESVLIIYGNVRLLVYTTKVKSTAGRVTVSRFREEEGHLKNSRERNLQMNAYSCREIINTENLDRIIKAKRLDTGQLTQLKRLRKRLKEHDGYAHKVKGWGYPAGDRKNGERGWYDIKFVHDMEFRHDY